MSKSDLLLAIAKRFPFLAKACVRVWLWGRILSGGDVLGERHWFINRVCETIHYRIPFRAKLGNGMPIKVHLNDFVGGRIIRDGYYEPDEVALVERLLKPGSVFIDIGAHVGQYALMASPLVGDAGSVHAFEPDPASYRWLVSNVKLNKLRNVTTQQMALGGQPGRTQFYISMVNDVGSNSLREPRRFSGTVVDVECVRLDEYVRGQNLSRVDLIKMDVEGAEHFVFEGAEAILSRDDRPVIMVEFEETRQKAFGWSCEELARDLEKHGYNLFQIAEEGLIPRRPRPDLHSYNVMAIPSDRVDEVRARLDG